MDESRYQVGNPCDESNASCSSEGAAEKLDIEEPHQIEVEPLKDTKQMTKTESEPVIYWVL